MDYAKVWRMWFPRSVDKKSIAGKLAEFYARSCEYHAMTSGGDKTQDPQVVLLSSLLCSAANYAEVGCGGGAVCKLVGEVANVVGMDVSAIAMENARQRCSGVPGCVRFIQASADCLPLPDSTFDGVYSFEVIEHVWEPAIMLREMIRIAKPGGFILISAPNRFSLDLHLPKKGAVRAVDLVLAAARRVYDVMTRQPYCHVPPDFDHGVYPDCDMITAIVPANFARLCRTLGCEVIFWDTTYMCAHRPGSRTGLDCQRYAGSPFFKHFGDHFLLLARKK